MARRADHTRDELEEMAINAALRLIEKDGFSKFSARKVATQIGYTIGTLYNVFGNYDNFILRINGSTLDAWYDHMQTALSDAEQKNPLHVLAYAYISYSKAHYERWLALFEYHLDEGHEVPDWYIEKLGRFFTLTEKALLPTLDNNKRKAKRAARVLWAGIHGVCVLSLSGKLDLVDADSPETLAISFIDNYISGLTRQ